MPTSASGSYSLLPLRFQNTPPGGGGQTLHTVLSDMASGIREARIQGGGGGGGLGSISTGQIASFTACVGDALATRLIAGPGITLSVNAANHTVEVIGNQATFSVGQVSSFTASVLDVVGAGLVAGANITISVNAITRAIEIIASSAVTGTVTTGQILSFTSSVRDVVGGALVAGTNITVSFDAATKLTKIESSGGGSGTTIASLGAITFTASGSGAVPRTTLSKLQDEVHVDDFGAVGNGTTDDYAAIMAAINSNPDLNRMIRVRFGPKDYRISQTLNLKRPVHLLGVGGNFAADPGTTIYVDEGKDGIIVNGTRTYGMYGTLSATTSSLSFTTDATNSIIEGLTIWKQVTTSLTAPTVVRLNGFDHVVVDVDPVRGKVLVRQGANGTTSSTHTFVDAPAQFKGPNRKWIYSGFKSIEYQIQLATPPDRFTIGETVTGVKSGATMVVDYIGTRYPVLVSINRTTDFTYSESIIGSLGGTGLICGETGTGKNQPPRGDALNTFVLGCYDYTAVTGPMTLGEATGMQPFCMHSERTYGTGIVLRTRATVRNCRVVQFPWRGILIKGSDFGTNANLSTIENVSCDNNGSDGVAIFGSDANACTLKQINVVNNGDCGIRDQSFLGNHIFSTHASINNNMAYYSSSDTSFGVWVGCYSEGTTDREPWHNNRSRYSDNVLVLGGDHGEGLGGGDGSLESTAPNQWRTGTFAIGKAFEMGTLDASGEMTTPALFTTDSADGVGVTTRNFGIYSAGYMGTRIMLTNERRRGGNEHIMGGYWGMAMSSASKWYGTEFQVYVRPDQGTQFLFTNSNAVCHPSISAGLITGLNIVYPGSGFVVAPTIVGGGNWASVTASTEIYQGAIISESMLAPVTASVAGPTLAMQLYSHSLVLKPYEAAGGIGNVPAIYAAGSLWGSGGSTCDLMLKPGGSGGRVMFGTFTTTAAAMTIQGWIEIKDAAGNLRRLAVLN